MTYFHGCYSIGDDTLWGVNHQRKGANNTLAASKSIRAALSDGTPIYLNLDNLSAHTGPAIRRWPQRNKVGLCALRLVLSAEAVFVDLRPGNYSAPLIREAECQKDGVGRGFPSRGRSA